MKKKIVYFLCKLGLIRMAEKISPSIVAYWRGEQMIKGIQDAFERFNNTMQSVTMGIASITEKINKYKKDNK